jgi:hypothetical protein
MTTWDGTVPAPYRVYLDGVRQLFVRGYDTEEGWVEVYIPNNEPRRHGVVTTEFVLPRLVECCVCRTDEFVEMDDYEPEQYIAGEWFLSCRSCGDEWVEDGDPRPGFDEAWRTIIADKRARDVGSPG